MPLVDSCINRQLLFCDKLVNFSSIKSQSLTALAEHLKTFPKWIFSIASELKVRIIFFIFQKTFLIKLVLKSHLSLQIISTNPEIKFCNRSIYSEVINVHLPDLANLLKHANHFHVKRLKISSKCCIKCKTFN